MSIDEKRPVANVAALRARIEGTPNDIDARQQLAEALFREGLLAEAEQQLQEAIRSKPDDGWNYLYLSTLAYHQKRYVEAVDHANKAKLLLPDNPTPYWTSASAFHGLGLMEHANAAYLDAVLVDPSDEMARKHLARWIDILPEIYGPEELEGKVGYDAETHGALGKECTDKIGLVPVRTTQSHNLAEVKKVGRIVRELVDRNELFDSEKLLNDVLSEPPTEDWIYLHLANIEYIKDNPSKALLHCKQALALSPNEPEFHCVAGFLYAQLDDLENANASFLNAVRIAPWDPRARKRLKDWLETLEGVFAED